MTLDRNPLATIMDKVFGSNTPPAMQQISINRFDSTTDKNRDKTDWFDKSPPPNIHQDNEYFLIKIQVGMGSTPGSKPRSMYIYDRQRSFEMHLLRERESEAFEAALEAMGENLKMYRWACRVGDFQWKICFDRAPARNPPW